ncbi:hypothetical protein UA38_11615 [Photobacterium kishitanii]|uniref:GlyGly-CTERM sorting domain-containing protein n=1 Tax=Photobacterium kishitanii TaxID=318456 RepID=A0AAX0YWF2_9GAMM|nr:GlyGly-CTERM sorting domain-containing protein [Photobacterium kishitanii]KJG57018.1 hypothetical protein UA38_11615 [Photobacterium kishitanii]KJG60542.1 hypothetical protein UA42_14400 [Photobacterium kishitanii]KJG64842.1 hypothetical protein UA40_14085 [Photobacterium kishitanii]KJG68480.1 hypothetical protein UA41_16505 [Photobacterium kishitanii]PSX18366.1 GlyGly-CTERM sorting domain-containing protein [Photobacterium kishitanii]
MKIKHLVIVSLATFISSSPLAGMIPYSVENMPKSESWPAYEAQTYNSQVESGFIGAISNIVVLYDPAFSPEQINRYVIEQVTLANNAHKINNVQYRRNIVAVLPWKLQGSNVAEAVDSFTYNEFDTLRKKYGASLVSIIIESDLKDAQCGVQNGYHTITAFNRQCALPTLLAHEWGHVDRLNHEYDLTESHFEDDNYAWQCGGKPTIMSANLNFNQFDLNNFYSDPNITRDGEACGTTVANNARVLNDTIQHQSAVWREVAPLNIVGKVTIEVDKNKSSESIKVITVTRDGDLTVPGSIEIYSDAVTAIPSRDYSELATRVTFAANENSKTVEFKIGSNNPVCETGTRSVLIGSRWGEKLSNSADLSLSVTTPLSVLNSKQCKGNIEEPSTDKDNNNSGGGGSTNLLALLSLLALAFTRRK